MRLRLAVLFAAVLLPAGAAAQKVPPVKDPNRVADVKSAPARVTEAQAMAAALTQVRADLAAARLNAWGGGLGGGIRPASVAGAGALFNPTGGKNGAPVYVVGVTAPNATGHVRVIVDAASGAVVGGSEVASWSWGMAPTYWKQGLNSPPPAKTNSPPPARR